MRDGFIGPQKARRAFIFFFVCFSASGAFAQDTVHSLAEEWITTIGSGSPSTAVLDAQGRIYLAGIGGVGVPITSNAFEPSPASTYFAQGFLVELDPSGTT